MTDHKFEPFQQVLVRDTADESTWVAAIFSHIRADCIFPFTTTNGAGFKFCIPYTPETAHLLGTSQPYESPVDEATRFKAGQLVEVRRLDGRWDTVMYLEYLYSEHRVYDFNTTHKTHAQPPDDIRPLPDDTAHLDAKP